MLDAGLARLGEGHERLESRLGQDESEHRHEDSAEPLVLDQFAALRAGIPDLEVVAGFPP